MTWRQYRVMGREVVYHPDVPPTIVAVTRVIVAESDEDAEAQATHETLKNPQRDCLGFAAVQI